MRCARGKATPQPHTKLRLFSESAGYCQKPDCHVNLFLQFGDKGIHIAEMAHIFSASDGGPRADKTMTAAERGAFENIILLCPSCHTIIDKAEEDFPDSVVVGWKENHRNKIAELFSVQAYPTREGARCAFDSALDENKTIFETYGPETDHRFNPESEIPTIWRRKVAERIIPNNQKIIRILDANRGLLNEEERATLEGFRQHVDDLEARHLGENVVAGGRRFPPSMATILKD